MNLESTIALFHHRWSVRVLAAFDASGGGVRLAVLRHGLRAHRDALRASLAALEAGGWVEPNPGYGHPLRPEWLLTRSGRRLAPACAAYDRVAARIRALPVAYRKWSAPVLVSVHGGAARFNAIQAALVDVTPRALALSLEALCGEALMVRHVDDADSPRSEYRLSRDGARLAAATREIARAI